jgi:hypothetical protein
MQLADLSWHQSILKRAHIDMIVAAHRFETHHFGKIAVELETAIDALAEALATIETARNVIEVQGAASC